MKPQVKIRKRLVLVGGGHAHVTTLRSFGMAPPPGLGVTLIARELDAPYSGMLPGYVAGHYGLDECHIDLVRLAHFAGARLIHGEAIGIDRRNRRVLIAGRPPIAYDILSIDTGITPFLDDIEGAREHAIAVKPVSTFAPRWQSLLARALDEDGPRRIAIVGNGAAGFELVLAIRHRLRQEAPARGIDPAAFQFAIIGAGPLLPTHNARARLLARRALATADVELVEGDAAVRITPETVELASGLRIASDATLITTRAAPPPWFASLDLSRDDKGFLAVRPTLQTLEDDDIFAVGDCASVLEHPREKAGVFAVRQGPPLTRNLRRRAAGDAALPFVPQRQFLTLLSLGDKSAIASRGPFAASGRWAWTWKDRIDRAFMHRFRDLPDVVLPAGEDLDCAGCAAKIGPRALARALETLELPARSSTVANLAPGDDAALLDLGGGQYRLETVDFFPALWPEPYVFGEIAAQHAMSDVIAKGGQPDHALVVAQLPRGARHLLEDDLVQLMAGARAIFEPRGVAIVGGHSGQSAELAAGFFVSGTVPRGGAILKAGLTPGDALILTKPLGTGLLFAAWMRRRARARHIAAALAGMRQSNAPAAAILFSHGATAATDVTGFGLVGHLLEMLRTSDLVAELDLTQCPLYPGVAELAAQGISSSLLVENLALRAELAGDEADDADTLAVIFDPQTSGGLLAGVPEQRAEACIAALRASGVAAAVIGRVHRRVEPNEAKVRLRGRLPGRDPKAR